jgi:transposase InsO family protein
MRYSASEKLEIIGLVEQSSLPARRTLRQLGVPPATFYNWYARYQAGGPEALADRPSRPDRVWNRIPDEQRIAIIDLALAEPELSPRELAVRFTERERYFVSEASVYRLLKAHDLITSPAFIVVSAAEEFHTKTTAPNQLWQTDFTYLKVIGWGWFYLSTVLDDFSRYVIAWKLCTTMAASDVTDTLQLALTASGCNEVRVRHRPRLLSDNGPSYIAGELVQWLAKNTMEHIRGAPGHPQTSGKIKRWHQTLKNRILLENYYLPGDLEGRSRVPPRFVAAAGSSPRCLRQVVGLAALGLTEMDLEAALAQSGEGSTCGVRLPPCQAHQLDQRGAGLRRDGCQHLAQLARRALRVRCGRGHRRPAGLLLPDVAALGRRLGRCGRRALAGLVRRVADFADATNHDGDSGVGTAPIAVLAPPEAPPNPVGV